MTSVVSIVLLVEYNHLGDGVAKNDSVRITHVDGDVLERERLEVVIGDDVVYNETGDSETTNDTFVVPGLVVEVDPDDEFNDVTDPTLLRSPWRVHSWRVGL